jgi:hypothetical protein
MDFVPPVTPELEAGVVEKVRIDRSGMVESNQKFGTSRKFGGEAEKEH